MNRQECKELCERLQATKMPIAGEAAEFITEVINSPYYDGYMAVLRTINNLNEELINGVTKIADETRQVTYKDEDGDTRKRRDEVNEKAFERSHKYITDIKTYYDQLEYFRNHLTPEEAEQAQTTVTSDLDEARRRMKQNGVSG